MATKIKNHIIFCILLFIFLSVDLYSQLFPFRYYTTDDKLSHSTVTAIHQDHKGYMWFGTLDGISIFDGYEFKFLSKDEGLNDRTVTSIFQDHNNRIWIGTYGGISVYEDGQFIKKELNNYLSELNVWGIYEINQGEIWVYTKGGGINVIKDDEVTYITKKNGLASDSINSVIKDKNGIIYIGTSNGLSVFKDNKFINYSTKDGLPVNLIKNLILDENNNLWIGTNNGISRFSEGKFKNFDVTDGLINNSVTDMFLGKEGSIWISTINGVSRFINNSFKSYSSKNGLSSDIILSMYEDYENNIWFGSYNKGISCLLNEEIITFRKESGLINNTVQAIAEDKSGNFWFGTPEGITVYNEKNIIHYNKENGLIYNDIWALFFDSKENLWIGTRNGLNQFDGKKFKTFNENKLLNKIFVFSFFEDSVSNIWIATVDDGLFKYDGKSFTHFTADDGLNTNTVYGITEDNHKNLWIGFSDGTLSIYDGNEFKLFVNPDIEEPGPIYSMQKDKNGVIWYSDFGNGIVSVDNNLFTLYNSPENIPGEAVVSLKIDNENRIWAGTNKGIVRYKDNYWKTFNVKSGLFSNEVTYNSGYVDRSGNVWFGTMRGAVKFINGNETKYHPAPPVYITRLQIFEKDTSLINGLELSHQQNFLKFNFTGICFKSPDDIEYRYKMIGLDKDWHVSKHRFVNYASLPPGNYEFIVNSRNQKGEWSEQYASFSFVINPPFYNTLWFRVVFIIVMSGLLLTFFKVKTITIRKRNEELEEIVYERTKQLEDEKNKADELLHNILPSEVIKELKVNGNTTPREYKSISILFTDFSGFTKIAAELPPEKLVEELNEVFMEFDNIIVKYKLEKLKTVGDSYMIGGGLPVESDDHAYQTVKAAIEMHNYLEEKNKNSNIQWKMRVGINSGQVIAGIVGKHKFTYDVWGNTVNVASALENFCKPGDITISENTYHYIKDHFHCEFAGKINCKGHGEIDSYIVCEEILN